MTDVGRPVLFLDIDGVLNHGGMEDLWKAHGSDALDPACIEQLRRVVAETGCDIVLSSVWRLLPRKLGVLAQALAPLQVFSITPNFPESYARGEEILDWLKRHRVEAFAIVDDDLDANIPGHFVLSNPDAGGLTAETADQLIAVLSRRPTPGIEQLSREEALAHFEERKAAVQQGIREFNAECLRDCLERCPDRIDRCATCSQGEVIAKIERGLLFLADGRVEPL